MTNEKTRTELEGRYVGVYILAGIPIKITSVYQRVHSMCAPYIADENPELAVETTEKEIEKERLRNSEDETNDYYYSSSYVETLLVYRKVATMLLKRNVLLMHGSCIAVGGKAVLFTALSGTGKSTHTRLWREMLGGCGKEYVMINDDKPLVEVPATGQPVIYGTPWDGKHHISTNISAPLHAIVYLQRGETNTIEEVTADRLFHVLVQQTFRPDNAIEATLVLNLLVALSHRIRFFCLHCNMNPEAAEVAYRAIFES